MTRAIIMTLIAIMTLEASQGCVKQINYPVEYAPAAEFLLGPEDVLVVTVWRNQDLSRDVVIRPDGLDRKSTRLNSSHGYISYSVFCLKKKNKSLAARLC